RDAKGAEQEFNVNSNQEYVGRLAPAPTGALHVGNARTFLVAWLRARLAGGGLILRLDDLEHPKVKPGKADEAYRDLAWLGLDWDAGPTESFTPRMRGNTASGDRHVQSRNLPLYAGALAVLDAKGRTYACACSRKDVERIQSAPNAFEDLGERAYPGTCRTRFNDLDSARAAAGGREPVIRFLLGDEDTVFEDGFMGRRGGGLAEWSGDFAVARGDRVSYQLATVVDDAATGITEVVRGDDLAPSTERQLAVYRALELRPPRFFHVPLVVGPDGRRLAKRHGDSRICRIRARGDSPARLLGWLAWSLGWLGKPRESAIEEILRMADFSTVPKKPAILDANALAWLGL
ncbi:MAG: hypothetical protein LBT97_02835, partial [Planctomycetota bacterium]|nr:hypothetical protein [Planctomycetota bacterium]